MIADIVHEATYRHPPELVWRAVATPEGLNAWMMVNDFREAKVGHRFRFTDRPRPFWDGICDCEVVEAEAQRRFSILWGTNGRGAPTRVTFTLTPTDDGGTRLEFRHGGMQGLLGWAMKKGMDGGWRGMVQRAIPFVLDGMARGQVPSRDEVRRVRTGR